MTVVRFNDRTPIFDVKDSFLLSQLLKHERIQAVWNSVHEEKTIHNQMDFAFVSWDKTILMINPLGIVLCSNEIRMILGYYLASYAKVNAIVQNTVTILENDMPRENGLHSKPSSFDWG